MAAAAANDLALEAENLYYRHVALGQAGFLIGCICDEIHWK